MDHIHERANDRLPKKNWDHSTGAIHSYNKPAEDAKSSKTVLFDFDPNTLSTEGWKRLGIRDKTITTIQNYIAKGGRFHKPADIAHIYGLFPDQVEKLLPYVKIADRTSAQANKNAHPWQLRDQPISQAKSARKELEAVDINAGDTSAFIALPGIGPKLALRIINFREKLGGFYSINQVAETFGLTDSVFQKIKPMLACKESSLRKLNINSDAADVLKNHPYIRWPLANAIIQYRKQHGKFESVDALKQIDLIDEQVFEKIIPYLTLG